MPIRPRTFVLLLALCLVCESPANARPFSPPKPDSSTQVQKSAKERGGNPCMTPDPGFGVYGAWSRAPSMGQMILPKRGGVTRAGEFDLMIHFHGHEAVRKEWVVAMDGPVLVGIDLGLGSGPYERAFAVPGTFEKLVESVELEVQKQRKLPRARARRIGLSGWSAGYGAIQSLLGREQVVRRVDSVVLLDGLHGSYLEKGGVRTLNDTQLGAFIRFAKLAARREKLMFMSHSSIIPPGYASTTETAAFLVDKVGGKAEKVKRRPRPITGLELISRFNRGNFLVRGFSGNDTLDHCAHVELYRDVLKVHIRPRWKSPRGFKQ